MFLRRAGLYSAAATHIRHPQRDFSRWRRTLLHPRPSSTSTHSPGQTRSTMDSGTNVSVKERKAGRVPAIVFEQEDGQHGGNKRLISVRTSQVRKLVNHLGRSFFLSRLFKLEVREGGFDDDGAIIERVRALPGKLRLHSATDAPLNVTFFRAPSHSLFKVEVPSV